MNFNTIKQELNKKIKLMGEEDFLKFISELTCVYVSNHIQSYSYHKIIEELTFYKKENRNDY